MKFSKATYVIAIITVILLGITVWATIQADRQRAKEIRLDQDIITAIKSGDAEKISALFTEGISFYTPSGGSDGNRKEAIKNLQSFFDQHSFVKFTQERVMQGEPASRTYLQGKLVTKDKIYRLDASIYNNKIEQLDISHLEE